MQTYFKTIIGLSALFVTSIACAQDYMYEPAHPENVFENIVGQDTQVSGEEGNQTITQSNINVAAGVATSISTHSKKVSIPADVYVPDDFSITEFQDKGNNDMVLKLTSHGNMQAMAEEIKNYSEEQGWKADSANQISFNGADLSFRKADREFVYTLGFNLVQDNEGIIHYQAVRSTAQKKQ